MKNSRYGKKKPESESNYKGKDSNNKRFSPSGRPSASNNPERPSSNRPFNNGKFSNKNSKDSFAPRGEKTNSGDTPRFSRDNKRSFDKSERFGKSSSQPSRGAGENRFKKFDDNRSQSTPYNRDGERKPFGKPAGRDFSDKGRFGNQANDSFRKSGPKRDFDNRDEFRSDKPYNKRFDNSSARSGVDKEDKKAWQKQLKENNAAAPGQKRRFDAKEERPSKFAKTAYKPYEEDNRFGKKKGRSFVAAKPEQEMPDYSKIRKPAKAKAVDESEELRLNRFISNSGICSRREADKLILNGEITVNGKVVTELGMKVLKTDMIKFNGKVIKPEKFIYVLLNKPKDFITTTDDPQNRKTVMQLVANACEERIYPVGRLDRNTTGLLLFTNDGELAEKLAHPSNESNKIYQVTLDKPITKADYEAILEGITLEDGEARVDALEILSLDKKILGIEIHIGRNRIVRRIFEHFGYDVVALDRVMFAGLTKKDLTRGHWRYLTEKEVIRLKYFK
ncbi:pseudouridine synthase [Penaeicola halotolerans]|uniref:pseudouridine synthase n=1 Tax=Penaeicola halotolerans TaxID=2793196 RepID=UPI001CF8583F|nr:pseudouridine synthase [Penaeicola halotolerans]